MRLAIIGLPQSGKSTIFNVLTGARGQGDDRGFSRTDPRITTISVLDKRVDYLKEIYRPKKATYAKIEYVLPSQIPGADFSKSEGGVWNQVRTCDGLLHVVRNFKGPGGGPAVPEDDFWRMEDEMVLNDLLVVEKRIERIDADTRRGKKSEGEEYARLCACRKILEDGKPLRSEPDLANAPALKGFTFLSAKPLLVIVNNEDEDEQMPVWDRVPEGVDRFVVRGRLQMDIATMSPDEAEEFLEAYHIQESALDRVIRHSFRFLNRISFFTVGPDEVKAWPITAGTPALEAAGTVHSDMQKGFIRAEVFSIEDLKACGSYAEARKAGLVRLEGKEYTVKDGDIIQFRFNV